MYKCRQAIRIMTSRVQKSPVVIPEYRQESLRLIGISEYALAESERYNFIFGAVHYQYGTVYFRYSLAGRIMDM